jgi:hypothetical protein
LRGPVTPSSTAVGSADHEIDAPAATAGTHEASVPVDDGHLAALAVRQRGETGLHPQARSVVSARIRRHLEGGGRAQCVQ